MCGWATTAVFLHHGPSKKTCKRIKRCPKRLQNDAREGSVTSLEGLSDAADGGVQKRTPRNRFIPIYWGGLFGDWFALGRVGAQTTTNLRCLFWGSVFGSDFGTVLGPIMSIWGHQNIGFALEGLQKLHFRQILIFLHLGSLLGGHFGAV